MKIAYTYVGIDIFHYGHLRLLQQAARTADHHICGLMTDEVCLSWLGNLVMNYDERLAILEDLKCVGEVMMQDSLSPEANLEEIYRRYPSDTIVLFQGHQSWRGMPGTQLVESRGGEIVRPDYYPRLSRKFIRDELNRNRRVDGSVPETGYSLGKLDLFSSGESSKANTLHALKPLLTQARIEPLYFFTTTQWKDARDEIIARVRASFAGKVVVRSSARAEDSLNESLAGFFESCLNVESQSTESVRDAVETVIESFGREGGGSDEDQILVQNQTHGVQMSGVVFTRNLKNNAPYYIINYDESGATDSVTAGMAGKKVEIPRDVNTQTLPRPWSRVLSAVQEVEQLLDDLVLDIEFALTNDDEIVIFQVRPLAAISKFADVPDTQIMLHRASLSGELEELAHVEDGRFALSDMCFWNPAEIIGDRAPNLSYSIYKYLVLHRAWNEGLPPLGYPRIERDLMIRLGDKPYIDVMTSFHALLPAELAPDIARDVAGACHARLHEYPELHDKIEFEIVPNVYSLCTDESSRELVGWLGKQRHQSFIEALQRLTQNVFDNYGKILETDLASFDRLTRLREERLAANNSGDCHGMVATALALLDDARTLGTPQFARMARLAFIGNQYLKDFVSCGAIDAGMANRILASIETVASELDRSFAGVIAGEVALEDFLARYGHLRPGTYDISKLPYSRESSYFEGGESRAVAGEFAMADPIDRGELTSRFDQYLTSFPVAVTGEFLLRFIEETIRYRELFKFEFTKNLSAALELIAEGGALLGLSREDMATLSVESLRGLLPGSTPLDAKSFLSMQILGWRETESQFSHVSLPPLIFSERDLSLVQTYSVRPDFITHGVVTGEIVELDRLAVDDYGSIHGKIVLVEEADPGYDWIFSKGIRGLITRFGGAASHMAIRCAEFDIPAAIGCGEVIYSGLAGKSLVQLDCSEGKILAIR